MCSSGHGSLRRDGFAAEAHRCSRNASFDERWGERALSTISSTSSSTTTNAAHERRSDSDLRVLVTGGAGFLGSHIVDALVARGDEVVVVDDLSTGDRANLDRHADLAVADVADLSALQRGIGSRRIDAVVHCAAKTKVVESMTKKDLYERVIVGGTRNVIETTRRLGASIVVNISTGGAIYGETPVCADENVPVDPQSNYGRFKAAAEKLVELSDLRAGALWLANLYGPRQRNHLEGGVIAIFLGCWKRGGPRTLFREWSYRRGFGDIAAGVQALP